MTLVSLQHILVVFQKGSDKTCRCFLQQIVIGTGLCLPFTDFLFEVVEKHHICQYLIGGSILVFHHFI